MATRTAVFHHPRPSLSLGASMLGFAAVFALRLIVEDPAEPIMFLLAIPIGVIASDRGLRAGMIAATVAAALVGVWDVVSDPHLTPIGYGARWATFFATGFSIGELTRRQRVAEERGSRWFEYSADLNCIADLNGNFVRVNRAFQEVLGYTVSDLVNTPYLAFVHPDDQEATAAESARLAASPTETIDFENRYRAADGTYRWLQWSASSSPEEKVIYATARDVTEAKRMEDELRELAQNDPLTGLLNRRHFEIEATKALDFVRRYGSGAALFLMDVDRFKEINDTLGHKAGDRVLIAIADAIGGGRSTDLCGRLGGDEFVVLLPGVGTKQAAVLAEDLLGRIKGISLDVNGKQLTVKTSIGVATASSSYDKTLDELLALADEAMYEAKRGGGSGYAIATSEAVG